MGLSVAIAALFCGPVLSDQISLLLSSLSDFPSAFQAVCVMSTKMPRNSEEVVFSGGSSRSLLCALCRDYFSVLPLRDC